MPILLEEIDQHSCSVKKLTGKLVLPLTLTLSLTLTQANMLNFNVAENLKLALPNTFWTRLQNTFGNSFFYRENGDDTAIIRAVDTIDFCLREEYGCVDVPDNFKKGETAEAFKF